MNPATSRFPPRGRWLGVVLVAAISILLSSGCRTSIPSIRSNERVAFLSFTRFDFFASQAPDAAMEVWTSEELNTPISWDQLVLSWNAFLPGGTLLLEARAIYPEGPTPYYQMGAWGAAEAQRHSVDGQKDQWAEVKTDTLVLRRAASAVQIRIGRRNGGNGQSPELRFVGVSLLNSRVIPRPGNEPRAAWGKILDVPQRSQLDYEGGRFWCSPTTVSMVLAWWAEKLGQPALDHDVPEVARGVYDPIWKGTGNWSFNAAYAGQFPGLRACVVRLSEVTELERWIDAGVPPICSIDAVKLKGRSAATDVGHLVVVAGFTKVGEVILNDPWAPPGQSGRKIVSRENFIRAWEHSYNTAYLIYPVGK